VCVVILRRFFARCVCRFLMSVVRHFLNDAFVGVFFNILIVEVLS